MTPSYLWQSLLCLLLFLPTALAALWFSLQARRCNELGDARGAARASRLARAWCLLSLLAASLVFVLAAAGLFPSAGRSAGF
ncbi:MAG: CD225/dispanin family protein [Acidimicrobiales bacterium]